MSTLSQKYTLLMKQLTALLEGEDNPMTNLSQFAALIFNHLGDINWAGFYLAVDNVAFEKRALKLGPFQGQVACTNIDYDTGVCGHVAKGMKSLIVADVAQFDGHIACDSRSRSELVCPLIVNGSLVAVFDIDSPELDRFQNEDLEGVEALLKLLAVATDWSERH